MNYGRSQKTIQGTKIKIALLFLNFSACFPKLNCFSKFPTDAYSMYVCISILFLFKNIIHHRKLKKNLFFAYHS